MPRKINFSVPPWNKRRWALFKRFISQPSVIEAAARYRREYKDSGLVPLWAYGDIIDGYLPDGCEDAYSAFLYNPDITDEELAELIKPPIEIISHVNKHVGLNSDPDKAYERYMHRIGADEMPDEVDPLFSQDTGLYLRIAPHARPTEIKAFITKYFDDEMSPHLEKQPIWDTKQSKYMDDRKSKTRQVIADNEPLRQRILALHAEGKKSSAIAEVIDSEFGIHYDSSYIRKIISDAKRK